MSKKSIAEVSPEQRLIGKALTRLREGLELTQVAFGQPAGFSRQAVSRWEMGLDRIGLETMMRLLAGQRLTLRHFQDAHDAVCGVPPPPKPLSIEERLEALERKLTRTSDEEFVADVAELLGRITDGRRARQLQGALREELEAEVVQPSAGRLQRSSRD